MALTADDMVKAFNEAQIDTPEKVTAVLDYVLAIVYQTRATAGVQQKVAEREANSARDLERISAAQAAEKAAEAAQVDKLAKLVELFPTEGDAKKG